MTPMYMKKKPIVFSVTPNRADRNSARIAPTP
jgi:hypothetical protein